MQTDHFTTPDGIQIHTVHWSPSTDSERIIIIVHGISEHSGRYAHVAEKFVAAGYYVYALDHRGHGQSGGDRLHVPSNTSYISDLKQYYDRIKDIHPKATIFMLGHSMGSVISLQFILTYPDAIKAIVVTGTATDMSSTVSPALRFVGNIIHAINPKAPISAPGGVGVLTRDPAMLRQAENDPLFYKGWTKTSSAKYVLETGDMIQERASEIHMPILIMHGEDDTLTPISGSHILYERASSADKTLKTWANMLHEIMNEVDREAVIETIVAWFNRH